MRYLLIGFAAVSAIALAQTPPPALHRLIARLRRRSGRPGGAIQLQSEFSAEPVVEIVVDVHT